MKGEKTNLLKTRPEPHPVNGGNPFRGELLQEVESLSNSQGENLKEDHTGKRSTRLRGADLFKRKKSERKAYPSCS